MEEEVGVVVNDVVIPLADLTNDAIKFGNGDSSGGGDDDDNGTTIDLLYCGRQLGVEVIPDSDGRCGPNNGPQCPSCQRLQSNPTTRIEILKRLFASLTRTKGYETFLIGSLRRCGGNLQETINHIKKQSNDSLKCVERNIALSAIPLPPPPALPQLSEGVTNQVSTLMATLGVTFEVAEHALRAFEYNAEEAADGILSNLAEIEMALFDEIEERSRKRVVIEESNTKRTEAILEAASASATTGDGNNSLNFLPNGMNFTSLVNNDDSSTVLPKVITTTSSGHRMILVDGRWSLDTRCVVCSSNVPSLTGGKYVCELCHLCEGCVQSKEEVVVHCCPGLKNGGHVHQYPLAFNLSKENTVMCDINGEGCCLQDNHNINIIPYGCWSSDTEDFDVCGVCVRRPAPFGYDRRLGRVVRQNMDISRGSSDINGGGADDNNNNNNNEDDDDDDDATRNFFACSALLELAEGNSGDDQDDDAGIISDERLIPNRRGSSRRPAFDDVAAEREAAAQWEGAVTANASLSSNDHPPVLLGSGVVGLTECRRNNVVSVGRGGSGNTNHSQVQNQDGSNNSHALLTPYEGQLSTEAREALDLYRSSSPSLLRSDDKHGGSATDEAHAEDLLRRAQAVVHGTSNKATIYDAVSSNRIDIASMLLMSQAFSPVTRQQHAAAAAAFGGNSINGEEEERSSSIITTTCWCGDAIAPGDAIGCLGGHAMHSSCAADLLLGGGQCPTCRQPLFFSKVATSEAEAAVAFAKGEVLRVQQEEEERVKHHVDELTKRGLEVSFEVGDIVRISPNVELCQKGQAEDPISGGWHDEMIPACGLEGRVTEVVTANDGNSNKAEVFTNDENNNKAVAVKVRSLGKHYYKKVRLIDDYCCPTCDEGGPSQQTGDYKCFKCDQCIECCRHRSNNYTNTRTTYCPQTSHEWHWNPSLLSLLRQSGKMGIVDETEVDDGVRIATGEAERRMLRLRGELVAVKKAREDVKAEMDLQISQTVLAKVGHTALPLWEESTAALREMADASGCELPDWQRACHLLLLSQQWGGDGDGDDSSDEANAKRASILNAVRSGDIDSAARIIRRYNAFRTAEAARWADAASPTAEYVVDPNTTVDLRAFPSSNSPRTGYSLTPLSKFSSRKEILDTNGNLWLQVAASRQPGDEVVEGVELSIANTRPGVRVSRNRDKKEGVIIRALPNNNLLVALEVRWDGQPQTSICFSADIRGMTLTRAPPPNQGWLCLRTGGVGSPAVVARESSNLRCFGCGGSMLPAKFGGSKYTTVKGKKVNKGDRLLVAATLEPVTVVDSSTEGQIFCSFLPLTESDINGQIGELTIKQNAPSNATHQKNKEIEKYNEERRGKRQKMQDNIHPQVGTEQKIEEDYAFWYRPDDLVFPRSCEGGLENDAEAVLFRGKIRTRRELVLLFEGNEAAAKNAWKEAKWATKQGGKQGSDHEAEKFASCAKGHLLHPRCLQSALLAGRCCPAIGCTEPLFVPGVSRSRNDDDDTCCANNSQATNDQAAALQVAAELSEHATTVTARISEGPGERTEQDISSAGVREPKMCPVCCSGPLVNDNCADMKTHHGQCSFVAIRGNSGSRQRCTPSGTYRVTSSEIAARMALVSADRKVIDVLPKCETHKTPVMFNGCLDCGHLFTDISWDDMPGWDPDAKTLLESIYYKKRDGKKAKMEDWK